VKRWPVTVELGLMGIIISQLIALPIGIYSAIRQDTWGDYLARSFAILSLSIPTFWLATMVIVLPSIWWNYAPPLTYIPFNVDPVGNLKMFIIPAVVLSLSMAGAIMRMVRTMMLEVMRQDYIRTAWAKGLKERVIVFRHAIKNALIPVVTILGGQLTLLVGGTVIIENIFQLPGMGQLVLSAATNRDYTVITAVMLIFAVGLVFINLTVDLTYGFLDRRIQYR
jgi:peptide/nickel transport system permease protein